MGTQRGERAEGQQVGGTCRQGIHAQVERGGRLPGTATQTPQITGGASALGSRKLLGGSKQRITYRV